jgi:hypothetical protein
MLDLSLIPPNYTGRKRDMRKFLVVILLASFCSVIRSSAGSEPDASKSD